MKQNFADTHYLLLYIFGILVTFDSAYNLKIPLMASHSNLVKQFILLFLCVGFGTKAQKIEAYKPVSNEVLKISSKILKEDRTVYIHLPKPDSLNPNKHFDVLYLMDGESHFDMLAQYTDYLSRWDVNVIPPMIVVGIVNTKRTRDLTPTSSNINYFGKPDTNAVSWMKPSGGNEQFLQFIKQELMPYIDGHYKTHDFKILAGHSFGGLASINCLLTHPDMFNAYIAISPSFWWDNEYMLKLANEKLNKDIKLNKQFFYSDASEGIADSSSFHTNLLKFNDILTTKGVKELRYTYKYYPTETHMTEPMPAYYDALRFIYKDWKNQSAK